LTPAWQDARVARLATHNPSGVVDLVPITFAAVDEHTLVTAIDHKPKRTPRLQRLANIRHDPRVSVLVDHYDDDWSTLWWVRLQGTATVVETPSDDQLAPLVAKYAPYRKRRPSGPMIVVTVARIRAWSAAG
jgi:PPOX class probable F420-dependent enzyme